MLTRKFKRLFQDFLEAFIPNKAHAIYAMILKIRKDLVSSLPPGKDQIDGLVTLAIEGEDEITRTAAVFELGKRMRFWITAHAALNQATITVGESIRSAMEDFPNASALGQVYTEQQQAYQKQVDRIDRQLDDITFAKIEEAVR